MSGPDHNKSEMRDMLRSLAARKNGVSTSEIPGYTIGQVGRGVVSLVSKGKLFPAVVTRKFVRYFSTQGAASAWLAEQLTAKPAKPRNELQISGFRNKAVAWWSQSVPAHYPTRPDGTPAYKHTVIPASEPERRPNPAGPGAAGKHNGSA